MGPSMPSDTLKPVLDTFIVDGPPGFKAYLQLLVKRTICNGARKQPPCHLEFTAAKRKQIMRVVVQSDMMIQHVNPQWQQNTESTARLDPASTNQEWVMELANRVGIEEKDQYGWSVYVMPQHAISCFLTTVSFIWGSFASHVYSSLQIP